MGRKRARSSASSLAGCPSEIWEDLERVAPWLRARNANGCAIWSRPSAQAHPWLFLDDLPAQKAVTVTKKYAALAVETSPDNAQVWIRAIAI
jgi:hypothetical protein